MRKEIWWLFWMILGSILIITFGPFTVHEHYLFGLMGLVLVLLTYLPKKIVFPIISIFIIIWTVEMYFGQANVQTSDRWRCVQAVCANYPQPIYVVTNGGSHDHQGLGYAYLAQKNGCNMFAVTQWKDQEPQTMAVMNEATVFSIENTDFYELNRFGVRKYVGDLKCGSNLTATIFEKELVVQ